MKRTNDNSREFGNGNINIRFTHDEIANIKAGNTTGLEILSETLFWLDSYFVGDEICLSNYETGAYIYNCHSDYLYIIGLSDINNILMEGKTLKLHAFRPTEDEKEIIERNL